MPDFVMSKHALERAVDMAVTAEEIRACWDNPAETYQSERTLSWHLTRGRVTLCVRETEAEPVVTTVLWATAAAWAADVEIGALDGRGTDYSGIRRVRRAKKRKGHG